VPVPHSSSSSTTSREHLDSRPSRVAASPGDGDDDVTGDDHVTGEPTRLRFRLAEDSFYEWIAAEAGDLSRGRRRPGEERAGPAAAGFWERWVESNWTSLLLLLANATSSEDDYDAAVLAATSADTDLREREDIEAEASAWTYWTNIVVQLLSSPLVALTVNRCAGCPLTNALSYRSLSGYQRHYPYHRPSPIGRYADALISHSPLKLNLARPV